MASMVREMDMEMQIGDEALRMLLLFVYRAWATCCMHIGSELIECAW